MPTAHSCPHTGNSGVPPYLLPSNSRVTTRASEGSGWDGKGLFPGLAFPVPAVLTAPPPEAVVF